MHLDHALECMDSIQKLEDAEGVSSLGGTDGKFRLSGMKVLNKTHKLSRTNESASEKIEKLKKSATDKAKQLWEWMTGNKNKKDKKEAGAGEHAEERTGDSAPEGTGDSAPERTGQSAAHNVYIVS